MGAEMLAVVPMIMGVSEGIAGYGAKNAQATMYDAEGIRLEGEANREASRIEDDGRRFAAQQKMMYIGSGVEIGGSAVVTLAQTDKWAKTEADATRDRGRALRAYNERSGRIARNEGMASFISGVGKGIGGAAQTYYTAHAGFGGGGGYKSNDPYATGHNYPTAKQLKRPGATTRIRPKVNR